MEIVLNGDKYDLPGPLPVADLLERLEIRTPRVAVMVNDAIVKRDKRGETFLAEGDRVEVIHMVGGG